MEFKITIPTSLSEIKLKQYQQFLKVASDNDENNFLQQKIVQIFCGVELKYVNAMKQKDVNDIANSILNLLNKKPKLINRFKIGSLEFGFIPNLDEMTNGEYIDLDTYIVDWQNMHRAMAVLYRPITKTQKERYLIEPYVSSITYAEVMEHAPLDVVISAVVFFWDLGKELLRSTANYLAHSREVQNILSKHSSVNGGVGTEAYTLSLKAMLQDLTKLQNFHYTSL